MTNLNLDELRLILSTIEGDRQGSWASDRGHKLSLLGNKVKQIIKTKEATNGR